MPCGATLVPSVGLSILSSPFSAPPSSIFEGFESRAKLHQQILCKVKRQFQLTLLSVFEIDSHCNLAIFVNSHVDRFHCGSSRLSSRPVSALLRTHFNTRG